MGLLGQQRGVGGECNVQWTAIMRLDQSQHPNQYIEMFAQQGFATSEANFLDTMSNEQACHACDFFKTQQVIFGQKLVVLVKYVLGHAVGAAKVAAVCD